MAWFAALLLAPAAARADLSIPGEHRLPSEVVFTGLLDFPAYRFVVAAVHIDHDAGTHESPPALPPTPVREGERLSTDPIYFQELRALPADASQPVTDAWLASSQAPTSGSFTRHALQVPIASSERLTRAHYHVRQIQAGWISIELLSDLVVMADGSEEPLFRFIPRSYEITSIEAPPGWQIYLMPHPSWPRFDSAPPLLCAVGDVLPLSPGPRTLVAIQGTPGPEGSVAGKPFIAWAAHLDAWSREGVFVASAAVASREQLEIQVEPGRPLGITVGTLYKDAWGRWFEDEEARLYPATWRDRWPLWCAVGGSAAVALTAGAWALRRRRRARG